MPMTTAIATLTQRLSQNWTHKSVVDIAGRRAGITDNETIEIDVIRRHVNEAVVSIAEQLYLSKRDHYGLTLQANFDKNIPDDAIEPGADGLYRITLADVPALAGNETLGFTENLSNAQTHFYKYLRDVQRVSINQKGGPITVNGIVLQRFRGNIVRKDFSELSHIASRYNDSTRYNIFWGRSGESIYLYIGEGILVERNSTALANTFYDYYTDSIILPSSKHKYIIKDLGGATVNNLTDSFGCFTLRCQRKPFLDNVDMSAHEANSTFYDNIDLPDEFVPLAISLTHKMLLEYRRESVPQALTQEIQGIMQSMKTGEQLEREFERQEREKREYGTQQRSMGMP